MKRYPTIALIALLAACTTRPAPDAGEPRGPDAPATDLGGQVAAPTDPPSSDTLAAGGAAADSSLIARLEREARALAHTEGCTAGECRTAPVGSRPCGGPRDYVVYCAARTDSAALFSKLDELARAERDYNRRSGMASTCEFREPPATAVQGGRCVAVPSTGPSIQ